MRRQTFTSLLINSRSKTAVTFIYMWKGMSITNAVQQTFSWLKGSSSNSLSCLLLVVPSIELEADKLNYRQITFCEIVTHEFIRYYKWKSYSEIILATTVQYWNQSLLRLNYYMLDRFYLRLTCASDNQFSVDLHIHWGNFSKFLE